MITKRKPQGVALVSVLVIGMTSIVFLMALASIVTSAVRASSANKWAEGLRNAAEIGADYAIDQFNAPNVYPCPLDADASSGIFTKVTTIPTAVLIASAVDGILPTPGVPNITVTVKVTQVFEPADWQYLEKHSAVYSPQLDPQKSKANGWANPPSGNLSSDSGGGFRVIDSTASNGLSSKTIRVVLKARFDSPPSGDGADPSSKNPNTSYFDRPLFSNTTLTINPPTDKTLTITDKSSKPMDGNSYLLNLTTNQKALIGPRTTINGNVTVSSGGPTSQKVASLGEQSKISGRLTTTGQVDEATVLFTPGETVTPGHDNVLANGDLPSTVRSTPNDEPVAPNLSSSALAQTLVAPSQQSSQAQALDSLSSVSRLSGDYSTNQLSSSGVNTPISIRNDSGTEALTRLFVENTNADSAVNINANTFSPVNNARNLQIWYEGAKPITIDLLSNGVFNGLIYAPNALVTLKGNGEFTGGLVSKSLNLEMSGTLNLDSSLKNLPNISAGEKDEFRLGYSKGLNGSAITGWQPVVWQELK